MKEQIREIKKQKRIFKNERGITLIALIITIIILVILAAVSIRVVYNMEIVGRAVNGTQDYAQRALEENRMVGNAENVIQNTLTKLKRIESLDVWDGTKKMPQVDSNRNWHIYTCSEMKFFADFVNGELTEEEYSEAISDGLEIVENETIVYLESNLDFGANWDSNGNLLSGTAWTPIGLTTATKFVGIFEGNNCQIQGVYVNSTKSDNGHGLFGNSNTIQNLTIKDSYIEGKTATGGIVGALRSGTLTNCHNINTTVVLKEGSFRTVGGIVGQASGNVSDCSNAGRIIGNGKDFSDITRCGGIAGFVANNLDIQVSNCKNTGEVIGKGDRIGGIAGAIGTTCTIANCTNGGNIDGKVGRVGGIAGATGTTCTITNCTNRGNITGEGGRFGGIAGSAGSSSVITSCINNGEIVLTGLSTWGGGICGICFGTVDKCVNNAKLTARESNYDGHFGGIAGGIGAECTGIITNCYNIGDVEGSGNATGGIVGWLSHTQSSGKVQNNYNIGQITADTNVGGVVGRPWPTFTVSNNYALENTAPTISDDEKKTSSEMKTDAFVTLLNTVTTTTTTIDPDTEEEITTTTTSTQDVWKKDTEGKNACYPILK